MPCSICWINYNYGEGYEFGFEDGYSQGINEVEKVWNIRTPTYNEVMAFRESDKTNENKLSENYTCHDFTADFKNNSFSAGYRCGYVYVEFKEPNHSHALVCFDPTDAELIFIEPQTDRIVTLKIGQEYDSLPQLGNVTDYDVIW